MREPIAASTRTERHVTTPPEVAVLAILAVAVIALVEAYPRVLNYADEGQFLYEARRIVDGDAPYRDFFTLYGVGSEWLLAVLFRLFGTTFGTARHAMAAVHAIIALQIYALARAFGVRRVLALAAIAVHAAVALPQFEMATPHWFGTAFFLAAWRATLAMGRRRRAVDGILAGTLVGVLLFIEHPKGLAALAGTLGVVVLSASGRTSVPSPRRAAAGYAAGLVAAAAVGTLALVTTAGAGPALDALVVTPLGHYHSIAIARLAWPGLLWHANPVEPHWPVMPVMSVMTLWLPLTVLIPAAETMRAAVRRSPIPWDALVLTAGEGSALVAVSYLPNPVHLATVIPMGVVVGAYAAEMGVASLTRRGLAGVGWVPALLLAGFGVQAAHVPPCRAPWYPEHVVTRFGRLDATPGTGEALRQLDAAVDGSRTLFAYPWCPGVYLVTGTRNPTRFQALLPGWSPHDHFMEAAETLRERQVPLVLACWSLFGSEPGDPVRAELNTAYTMKGRTAFGTLFTRRADAP